MPAHGSPSQNSISSGAKGRSTVRWVRAWISFSFKPANSGIWSRDSCFGTTPYGSSAARATVTDVALQGVQVSDQVGHLLSREERPRQLFLADHLEHSRPVLPERRHHGNVRVRVFALPQFRLAARRVVVALFA